MKHLPVVVVIITCFILMGLAIPPAQQNNIGVANTLNWFREGASEFAESTRQLEVAIGKLKRNDKKALADAKNALAQCRLHYKRIEFFLQYFWPTISVVYNAPPVNEVEEPFIEFREPTGLQVIEAILYDKDPAGQRQDLLQQVRLIQSSAGDLTSLLYDLEISDRQILESIRIELIRIFTLGITGYDAPELKTGIQEASQSLQAIQAIITPYLAPRCSEADSVTHYLNIALEKVKNNIPFDGFDRLAFLTNAGLPLQQYIHQLIKCRQLELNTTGVLNHDAGNIFSKDAIVMNNRRSVDTVLVQLGKALFFDKRLSGNKSRSCASCHQPENYYTDGLPKSIALDGKGTVSRNAPTLLYATWQYAQFLDARVKTMDEQILSVLHNPLEMDANEPVLLQQLNADTLYRSYFNDAFPGRGDSSVTMNQVTTSLIAFVQTLSPFNAPFDRYIAGQKEAMTRQQVNGFNLFMGKAKCGTCHFAPLFNGLVPPLYSRTELEVLGVTQKPDFRRPVLDKDSGRFATYPIPFLKGAFKTPTLRNIARTAPYMHNGAFTTLQQVMDFYNLGGGVGLGLHVPEQTLSSNPLHLSQKEIQDIISFMNALTDSISYIPKPTL